jgi:dipeptidyl aminopeptidase/acylaminoacyl peptidase
MRARSTILQTITLSLILISSLPSSPRTETGGAAADIREMHIGEWLVLGPLTVHAPAFSGEEKSFEMADFFAGYDFLPVAKLRPEKGSSADFLGESVAWRTARADTGGAELPAGSDSPRVAYLAIYIETHRWDDMSVEAKGTHPFELFVNGASILKSKKRDGEMDGNVELQAGKHLLVVKTVHVPADTLTEWRIDVRLTPKYGAPELSTSPKRPFSIDLILESSAVSNSVISPDGRLIAFEVTERSPPAWERETRIEIRETAGGRLLRTMKGSSFRDLQWAPSGKRLSYHDGDGSLIILDLEGGGALTILEKVEDLEGYSWSPGGDYIVYSVSDKPKKDETGVKRLLGIYDRTPYGRNRSFLYMVSVPGGVTKRLTAGKYSAYLQAIHPEGRSLLVSRFYEDLSTRPYGFTELITMDLEDMSTETLLRGAWIRSAEWSPDGGRILILAGPSTFGEMGKNVPAGTIPNDYDTQAYILDPETGAIEAMTREFDPAIAGAWWSRVDGKIYFLAEEGTFQRLFRCDPGKRTFERIDLGLEYISDVDVARYALTAVVSAMGAREPLRLYAADLKKATAKKVFDPAAEGFADVVLGDVKEWEFEGSSGRRLDGLVYYPPGFDETGKYPCIVYYYGGTSPLGRYFGGRYPNNLWAANGYIVYMINPSGATGYGQAFSAFHVNDWGGVVSGEIIEGVTGFLEAHPFVDPTRIGCIGASFGGFMTQLLVTRTDIFSAAVSHAGISDITSYWGEGYWGALYNAVAAANSFPWNRPDIYVERSPLFSADKITTPLLLLHGASDTNVPPGESEQMYTALKLLGRDVEYIKYEGQSHFILDPDKRLAWSNAILAWFDRWLKDEPEWWNGMYPTIEEPPPAPIGATRIDLGEYGVVMMGEVTRDDILDNLPGWDSEYFEYVPDPAVLAELQGRIHDIEITVVLGTWCSDSSREIPRLWKILEEIGYPVDDITMFAVGSSRFTLEMGLATDVLEWSNRTKRYYDVERVATIIVYRGGAEIGRIVETPVKSVEEDLLAILNE